MNEDIKYIYEDMLCLDLRLMFYHNVRVSMTAQDDTAHYIFADPFEEQVGIYDHYTFYKKYGIFKPI